MAAFLPVGQCQSVGLTKVLGGEGVACPRIEHLGQTEVQSGAFAASQVRVGQQRLHRCHIFRGKLISTHRSELCIGTCVALVMPQRLTEGPLSPIEVALLFLEGAEIAVGGREIRVESQRSW